MIQINYRNNFDFILSVYDGSGKEIGFPDFDWKATFFTYSEVNTFTASSINGVMTNCRNDNGRIRIFAYRHNLGCGILHIRFCCFLPDGRQAYASVKPPGVVLVDHGCRDTVHIGDISVSFPEATIAQLTAKTEQAIGKAEQAMSAAQAIAEMWERKEKELATKQELAEEIAKINAVNADDFYTKQQSDDRFAQKGEAGQSVEALTEEECDSLLKEIFGD